MPDPVRVFVSYAHEDDALRERLEQVLRPLEREFGLECFTDRAILPGRKWSREIDAHLRDADLILLLVSDAFLASDYIHSVEMQAALEEHSQDSGQVIPIIVRACDWTAAPFASFQALPRDGRAVTSWPNQDEAWADVARGLRLAVEGLGAAPRTATGPAVAPFADPSEILRFLKRTIGSQRTTIGVQVTASVLLFLLGLSGSAAALVGVGLLVPPEARAVQFLGGLLVFASSPLLLAGQTRRRNRVAAQRLLLEQANRECQTSGHISAQTLRSIHLLWTQSLGAYERTGP